MQEILTLKLAFLNWVLTSEHTMRVRAYVHYVRASTTSFKLQCARAREEHLHGRPSHVVRYVRSGSGSLARSVRQSLLGGHKNGAGSALDDTDAVLVGRVGTTSWRENAATQMFVQAYHELTTHMFPAFYKLISSNGSAGWSLKQIDVVLPVICFHVDIR